MSELPRAVETQSKRETRHPLLYQQRLNEECFWPAILTIATAAALVVWDPPKLQPYHLALVATLGWAAMVLVLTYVYRLRAYAACTANAVHVRLPFHRFEISYDDIKAVRPTELFRMFPRQEQSWSERRFLEPILGSTVLAIDLDELPGRKAWLRLWMSKFMLCPDRPGVIIAVRDWMAFRAELDESRARYKQMRA